MNRLYRFGQIVLRGLMHIMFRYKVIGVENVPKSGPLILCSNHLSYMDPVFLALYLDRQIFFMAKEELFKNKLFAKLITKLGAFPIKRGGRDASGVQNAIDLVQSGRIMGIFPEGTRSKTGAPGRGKAGTALISYMAKANVTPVSIYCEGKIRLFKKVTVRFGKLIRFQDLDMKDDSRNELKRVSNLIMDHITQQWEEKHAR